MKVEQTILDHFVQKKHILVLQSVELAAGCDIKYLFQKIGALSVFQYLYKAGIIIGTVSLSFEHFSSDEKKYLLKSVGI